MERMGNFIWCVGELERLPQMRFLLVDYDDRMFVEVGNDFFFECSCDHMVNCDVINYVEVETDHVYRVMSCAGIAGVCSMFLVVVVIFDLIDFVVDFVVVIVVELE